jgi:thymidylate synthase
MADREYLDLLTKIRDHGAPVVTRNAPVRRVFAHSVRFTRTPLVCLRKTAWRLALREMEWALSGSDNISDLHESARHWWRPWADRYGRQLRDFAGHGGRSADQIIDLLGGLILHPYSRRNVVTTWNSADMTAPETPITNCWWTVLQAFVEPDSALHLVTYQRSADVVVGLPANWLQSWAFLMWLAHSAGLDVGSLTWLGGDVHVYDCHAPVVAEILAADPDPDPPRLVYRPSGDAFRADDFALDRPYNPKVLTRAEMVV